MTDTGYIEETSGRFIAKSRRLTMLKHLRRVARDRGLTDAQLDTITMFVGGEIASNAPSNALHAATIQLIVLDAEKVQEWVTELEAREHERSTSAG